MAPWCATVQITWFFSCLSKIFWCSTFIFCLHYWFICKGSKLPINHCLEFVCQIVQKNLWIIARVHPRLAEWYQKEKQRQVAMQRVLLSFDFPLLLEFGPSYGALWKLFLTSWGRENSEKKLIRTIFWLYRL